MPKIVRGQLSQDALIIATLVTVDANEGQSATRRLRGAFLSDNKT